MRAFPATVLLVLVLLAGGATAAPSPVTFGVNEDQPKFAEDDGASIYGQLRTAGLTQNVVSVTWNPAAPTAIDNAARLGRAIAAASSRGIRVVLAVYPATARAVVDNGATGFVAYCRLVAQTFPTVDTFVVGNEPNQPRFWQPQFGPDGTQASAASFYQALKGCYDVLHPLGKTVVGVGLSPRGNDDPDAPSNVSTSPVRFLVALGAAYRKDGRTAPIMDALGFHPYPNVNTDAPTAGYRWPNAGVPDANRVKQAFEDAFGATAQPTFANGLKLWYDELGWQADTQGRAGYSGDENVPAVTEAQQADFHAQALKLAACDADVASVNLFHWIDESDRGRFQSGAYRADGSARPSLAAVAQAVADTAGGTRCTGTPVTFAPARGVVAAAADFGSLAAKPTGQTAFAFSATAEENANATFALVSVPDASRLTAAELSSVRSKLAAGAAGGPIVVAKDALVRANFRPRLELRAADLDRGFYVYAILLRAETNPARTSFFASTPFEAGSGAAAAATAAPAPTTGMATRVLLESALLNGGVQAGRGAAYDVWFEYGPGTTLVRKTRVQRLAGGDDSISAQLKNLSPRAKWSYRIVARPASGGAAVAGATRSFTVEKPALRTAPLVVVDDVQDQRGAVAVDAIVSATAKVTIELNVRRLPSSGVHGDASFRTVDSLTTDTGVAGEDVFTTLESSRLPAGARTSARWSPRTAGGR